MWRFLREVVFWQSNMNTRFTSLHHDHCVCVWGKGRVLLAVTCGCYFPVKGTMSGSESSLCKCPVLIDLLVPPWTSAARLISQPTVHQRHAGCSSLFPLQREWQDSACWPIHLEVLYFTFNLFSSLPLCPLPSLSLWLFGRNVGRWSSCVLLRMVLKFVSDLKER